MTNIHAERARALVGCAFRPQGRDAATGLDCLGLIASVYRIPPLLVPRDYRLRGSHLQRLGHGMHEFFRRVRTSSVRAGDVLLYSIAPDQLHLGVRTDNGFVHAHAGLRRVVETPGEGPWPLIRAYRRRVRRKRRG